MPRRAPLRCRFKGCPRTVKSSGFCDEHGRTYDRGVKAAQPWRDYGGDWPKIRRRVLAEEPFCRCGCGRLSVDVDHIVPLQDGGTHDRSNLQALAHGCHTRKTLRESRQRRHSRRG